MTAILFVVVLVVAPLVAAVVEFVLTPGLSERHHSHHDTYSMSTAISSVLVFAMIVMGLLGLVFGWLCWMHVFRADHLVMLGFFASFVIVMFVMWSAMRRYNVSTYEDHMEVTPFVGRKRSIRYSDIEHLRWSGDSVLGGDRSVSVIVNGRVAAVLVGMLDLEPILLSINRDDVLD